MKIFIVKGFTFVLIGYSFLFITYNYLITGHDDEKFLIKKYLKNREKIEAIAIGTSHTWAINFRSLGINGIGLGVGGRDYTECKYILDYLLSQKPNSIKEVFISYSYFSLYQDNNTLDTSITDTRLFMYNNIPSWKILPGDLKNFIVGKFLPFIQSDHWRTIWIRELKRITRTAVLFIGADHAEAKVAGKEMKKATHMLPLKEIEARIASQIAIHERAKHHSAYDIKEHNLNVMKDIIKMLKAKGVEPIFFTPPYYYKYTELYNKAYVREMKVEMRKLVDRYNAIYLDFSMDGDFIYNSEYFNDADHINLKASRILAGKINMALIGTKHDGKDNKTQGLK